jgi:hypothetical protein
MQREQAFPGILTNVTTRFAVLDEVHAEAPDHQSTEMSFLFFANKYSEIVKCCFKLCNLTCHTRRKESSDLQVGLQIVCVCVKTFALGGLALGSLRRLFTFIVHYSFVHCKTQNQWNERMKEAPSLVVARHALWIR